tara:strand:- start:2198 stop:4138 length:1941 start_codon:yes stop_codon:yes gene_type:complete
MIKIASEIFYCHSIVKYQRFKSHEVKVGHIGIGGNNPIRIQSMTTTDTLNTSETVNQCIGLIKAGCEIIRITAPSRKESENLFNIKNKLIQLGYNTPLVADIHFTPNAAEIAASIVEKVRINPGNYADKKKFKKIDYSTKSYDEELKRINERFLPLLKICKKNKTAIRIGTNHGSLSDRILSKYGDTPRGMVESAMEFLRICKKNSFKNVIISMKASNTIVMVNAYRLLINQMNIESMTYPLHLGVTEAGDGLDGRIKSAVGIGALLEDGIGDTIRVSLTEEPIYEIPVAKKLAQRYFNRDKHDKIKKLNNNPINPFQYFRRQSNEILNVGGKNVPIIISNLSNIKKISRLSLKEIGYTYSSLLDKWNISDFAADFVFCGDNFIDFDFPGTLKLIYNYTFWKKINQKNTFPIFKSFKDLKEFKNKNILKFLSINANNLDILRFSEIKKDSNLVLIIETNNSHGLAEQRRFFIEMMNKEFRHPIIIKRKYNESQIEKLHLFSATDIGGLLIDGLGDGIFIENNNFNNKQIIKLSFNILQATRTRISKTEYISCPSCGRTLFDLQETTSKIRSKTNHLKGIKIGIMGCIVNGPGEMADADYGYVGTGHNKITLYKEKKIMKRNIPSNKAVDELINLIKENGDWKDNIL